MISTGRKYKKPLRVYVICIQKNNFESVLFSYRRIIVKSFQNKFNKYIILSLTKLPFNFNSI